MRGGRGTEVRHSIFGHWCPTGYYAWPSHVPPAHKWPNLRCIVAGKTLCWRLPHVPAHWIERRPGGLSVRPVSSPIVGRCMGHAFQRKEVPYDIIRINRSTRPMSKLYSLCNTILSEVNCAKYLDVNITNDLQCSNHISGISSQANSWLEYIRQISGTTLRSLKIMLTYPW